MKLRVLLPAVGILTALATAYAVAGGVFTNGLPNATGVLTGNEEFPADTNLPNGQNPQSEAITPGQIIGYGRTLQGASGLRNLLIGGDFGTNPWQRGTSFTGITSTPTYTADRFAAVGAAGSSISVSRQTGAADITTGFNASLRLQRAASNADVSPICIQQVIETNDSVRAQGQVMALSFSAFQGANFSAAGATLNWTVATGTGTNQSAALFAAGTWTGYAAKTGTITLATNPTAWTRYSATTVALPATATQVGMSICYTPVGTAGAADWVEFAGVQLEVSPTGTASAFERTPQSKVLYDAQRYFQNYAEPPNLSALARGYEQNGQQQCTVTLPFLNTMRVAPTVTVSSGTFQVLTATSPGFGPIQAGTTNFIASAQQVPSTTAVTLVATGPGTTIGLGCGIAGGGGTGSVQLNSEL